MQTPEQRRAYSKRITSDPIKVAKRREYHRNWMRRRSGGDPDSTTRPRPANRLLATYLER